jgi:hypothetical protein
MGAECQGGASVSSNDGECVLCEAVAWWDCYVSAGNIVYVTYMSHMLRVARVVLQ